MSNCCFQCACLHTLAPLNPSPSLHTPARTNSCFPCTPLPCPSPQVGAVLQVYGRGFQLLDADAYTLQYMEREAAAAPGRFPWADPSRVLARLSDWVAMYAEQLPDRLRAELLAADRDGSGYIDKFRLYVSTRGVMGGVRRRAVEYKCVMGMQLAWP